MIDRHRDDLMTVFRKFCWRRIMMAAAHPRRCQLVEMEIDDRPIPVPVIINDAISAAHNLVNFGHCYRFGARKKPSAAVSAGARPRPRLPVFGQPSDADFDVLARTSAVRIRF